MEREDWDEREGSLIIRRCCRGSAGGSTESAKSRSSSRGQLGADTGAQMLEAGTRCCHDHGGNN